MGKGAERDIVGILSVTLGIVVFIVLLQNAGGAAELVRAFVNSWNALLGTLLGRAGERA